MTMMTTQKHLILLGIIQIMEESRRRPSPTPPRRRLTPTPEIITGGVRVPPRPPQRYDPYAENEDQFPDVVNDNDDYSETFDTTRHHSNHGGIRKKPVRPGRPNNDGTNNYEVLLQNAVKNGGSDEVDTDNDNPNIKVSSDGYNGYKEINTGYPDKDQDSDAYNGYKEINTGYPDKDQDS